MVVAGCVGGGRQRMRPGFRTGLGRAVSASGSRSFFGRLAVREGALDGTSRAAGKGGFVLESRRSSCRWFARRDDRGPADKIISGISSTPGGVIRAAQSPLGAMAVALSLLLAPMAVVR